MSLAKFEIRSTGLEADEIPADWNLHTPEPFIGQYASKLNPYTPVFPAGFSTGGCSVSPGELKFRTLMVPVPAYCKTLTGFKDLSIDILSDPSILSRITKDMAARSGTSVTGFSKRGSLSVKNASDIRGDYLNKLIWLHDTMERNISSGIWRFIKDFDLDIPNRLWKITFEPETIDVVLTLFKSMIDIERIGHSTPKGLIEMPLGMGGAEGRPGPIYKMSGLNGAFTKLNSPYIITNKEQLIAVHGAMFSYLQMTDTYNEFGLIKGAQLIDAMLRNGLYGTLGLREVIQLIPLFARYGVSPAIYHLALGPTFALRKHARIHALELFLARFWMFMRYVAMIKESGIGNFETEVTYKYMGRTPVTQEILDQAFAYGLHPLQDDILGGPVKYYYPPTSSAHLKLGMHMLISDNSKFRNTISCQSTMRPTKMRSQPVYFSEFQHDMPDMVAEQKDWAVIISVPEAHKSLRRELYGSPQEFDEFEIYGRITTSNGYHVQSAQMGLIDTLLVGGMPLYEWDQVYRPIHARYTAASMHTNAFIDSYAKHHDDLLRYAQKLEADSIRQGKAMYQGGSKWVNFSSLSKEEKTNLLRKITRTKGQTPPFMVDDPMAFFEEMLNEMKSRII
jgi:hypothetical protein